MRRCTRRKTTRCPCNTNVWLLISKPARPTSTRGYRIILQIMLPCEAHSIKPSPPHMLSSTRMLPSLLTTARWCTLHHSHRLSRLTICRNNSKRHNHLCIHHTIPQRGLLRTGRCITSVLRPYPILRMFLAIHRRSTVRVLFNEQTTAISDACPCLPSRCLPKIPSKHCNPLTAAKTQHHRHTLPTKRLSLLGGCNHRHNQHHKPKLNSNDGRTRIWAAMRIIALLPQHRFRQKRKCWSVLATALTQMTPWQQCSWPEAKVFRSLFIIPTSFNFTRPASHIRRMTPWAPPYPQAPSTYHPMTT